MPILTLQYLRGVAAMMVVMLHIEGQIKRFGYTEPWPAWLASGVDLFFILSGFLMWAITAECRQSPRDFFAHRAARIVPLYWLITTCIVAIMLFAPSLLLTGRFLLSQVIGSYLFLGLPDVAGVPVPVVRVGWTLNMEMMFYVIFAASLAISRSYRGIAIAVTFAVVVFLGSFVLPLTRWTQIYTSSILFEFIFGMVIAEMYRRRPLHKINARLAFSLITIGGISMTFTAPSGPFRGLLVGIPAAVFFVGTLAMNEWALKHRLAWLELLGDASYSIYLTHLISLSIAFQVWHLLGLSTQRSHMWTFLLYGLLLCVAIGILVYKLIEIPLTRHFQRKISKSLRFNRAVSPA